MQLWNRQNVALLGNSGNSMTRFSWHCTYKKPFRIPLVVIATVDVNA